MISLVTCIFSSLTRLCTTKLFTTREFIIDKHFVRKSMPSGASLLIQRIGRLFQICNFNAVNTALKNEDVTVFCQHQSASHTVYNADYGFRYRECQSLAEVLLKSRF
jgi:hypothetical protein